MILCLIAVLAILGGTLLALSLGEPPPEPASTATKNISTSLREAVSPQGIMEHERRLQAIADENGGSRAAGTPGYDASAEYVARTLKNAGYHISIQRFGLPEHGEIESANLRLASPETRNYEEGVDFVPMAYSGSRSAAGRVVPVDAEAGSTSSGCEAGDFGGFSDGDVALLRRGACTFEQKARNAEAAGASAALIFDDATSRSESFAGSLGEPGTGIPVLGTSSSAGNKLLAESHDGDAWVRVSARNLPGSRTTTNVIAETRNGDADNVVMVGAHLDPVSEGPGINDNGSGASTILEIAEQMHKLNVHPRNEVRFAFWGAEELGLVGSQHYVEGLDASKLDHISAYLNFDMVGSPNHVRFVYGSREVTGAFEDYFAARKLGSTETLNLTGRSDHGPFEEAGIPAGGLFSGAEGTKSADEAESYGGEAGRPYDPCYHEACDDLGNVDREAVDEMSDAAANAVAILAQRE